MAWILGLVRMLNRYSATSLICLVRVALSTTYTIPRAPSVGRDVNKGISIRVTFNEPANLGGGYGKQVPVTLGGADSVFNNLLSVKITWISKRSRLLRRSRQQGERIPVYRFFSMCVEYGVFLCQ
jgi:hypothetical protein